MERIPTSVSLIAAIGQTLVVKARSRGNAFNDESDWTKILRKADENHEIWTNEIGLSFELRRKRHDLEIIIYKLQYSKNIRPYRTLDWQLPP
jgi:hypothetical protein